MNAGGKENPKARTAEASKTGPQVGKAREIKSKTGSGSALAGLCGCKCPFSALKRYPHEAQPGEFAARYYRASGAAQR